MHRPGGLKPTRRDIRTLNHEVQFGSIPLSQLPKGGLGRIPLSIKDQLWTLLCTAFCTSTASEYIEKIVMSPEYQAAKIAQIEGQDSIIETGASAESALKSLRTAGTLPQKDARHTLAKDGAPSVSVTSWTAEDDKIAAGYKKASTYDIMAGSYDVFDNIRVALFLAKQQGEERVGMAFTRWYDSWQGVEKTFRPGTGNYSWHAHLFIDWIEKNGEIYLVEQNSYGKDWGRDGLSHWTREAVNQLKEDSRNKVHMARDLSPEDAKAAQWSAGMKLYDMLVKIDATGAIKWLVEFVTGWLSDWQEPPTPPTPPVTPPPPPAPKPVPETNREKLLKVVKSFIGLDASPRDVVDDDVGCAESVSNIIRKVFPAFNAPIVSTASLAAELDKRTDLFKRTTFYKPGCVIVSPRTATVNGHTGIFIEGSRIVSNNSKNGLMENNYGWSDWVTAFKDKKGLRILIWEPL